MPIVLKGIEDEDKVVRSYGFHCPGCSYTHQIRIAPHPAFPSPTWDWNGSVEAPTFTPSVLVTSAQYPANGSKADQDEYDSFRSAGAMLSSRFRTVCHSFVAEGVIDFLGDCTHALRGKHALPPHPRVPQVES